MAPCPHWRVRTGADEKVRSLGRVDDLEALTAGRTNDHNLVHGGMAAERVGGSYCGVPGDQHSDLHEGSTGCQSSVGDGWSLFFNTATTTAVTAAKMRRGGKRFTSRKSMTAARHARIVLVSNVIDHLIVCVDDLDEGARDFQDRLGLGSLEGGSHPGHGTANRIIPLGDFYIELLAVVDSAEAGNSPFGSWATRQATTEGLVHAICVRTDDLDGVCTRLGLESTAMSRHRPDGTELKWSVAGVDLAISESLPFFIEWHVSESQMPGRSRVVHDREVDQVEEIVLSGDPARLEKWAAGVTGISAIAGPPSIVSVSLRTPDGPLILY